MARPIEFDYDNVLDNAMLQFWREGYEASSVQKLLDATGINRGTLYNSFGDKDKFFELSVGHYNSKLKVKINMTLGNNSLSAESAIEAYVKSILIDVPAKQRVMGCLLVNSVCECINLDKELQKLIRKSLNVVQRALLNRTREMEKARLLKRGLKADLAAESLMTLLYGLCIGARSGKSPRHLADMFKIGMNAIKK